MFIYRSLLFCDRLEANAYLQFRISSARALSAMHRIAGLFSCMSPRQLYISRANRDISSSLFGPKMGRNMNAAQAVVDPARKRDILDRSLFQPNSLKTIFYSPDISLTDGAVHHEIIQH